MKERPIIMREEEVRAILEERKSQTRRIMKPQPQPNGIWSASLGDFLCLIDEYPPSATIWNGAWLGADAGELNCCPYGVPGDRLWVRETWSGQKQRPLAMGGLFYRADGETRGRQEPLSYIDREDRWRPSIHMPRWASRLTLEIKAVRVERLQEISADDVIEEGVDTRDVPGLGSDASFRTYWLKRWDAIYAKRGYGWDTNPWVWVIESERVD